MKWGRAHHDLGGRWQRVISMDASPCRKCPLTTSPATWEGAQGPIPQA